MCVGIGGSYLGAKAVIDALDSGLNNTNPEVLFAGHHLGPSYLPALFEYLEDKSVFVNVISKSGTTLEPAERVMHTLIAIAYGAFLAFLIPQMIEWYGEPTGFHLEQHGFLAWVFSAMAVGVFVSGVRDVIAARTLDRTASYSI